MIMRLAWLLVATIHALDINQMPLGNCTKIYVRKEFRDLTKNEWNAYKEAMFKLQDTPSRDGGAYSEWDRITSLHVQNGHKFHGYRLYGVLILVLLWLKDSSLYALASYFDGCL